MPLEPLDPPRLARGGYDRAGGVVVVGRADTVQPRLIGDDRHVGYGGYVGAKVVGMIADLADRGLAERLELEARERWTELDADRFNPLPESVSADQKKRSPSQWGCRRKRDLLLTLRQTANRSLQAS